MHIFYFKIIQNEKDLEIKGIGKYKEELIKNAKKITREGHGILAADENTETIGNRFKAINVENNEENRRSYRELLFTSPGIENYISGVILYDETMYQKTKDGTNFTDLLTKLGILIGIKLDTGVVELGTKNETSSQGLDDLGKRCAKYYADGARFAKWKSNIKIDKKNGLPSELAINENAHGLARYAVICQENGLVPILEPDVFVDGSHSIDECAAVCEKVFASVVREASFYGILWEGALLKPNMITPGSESNKKVSSQEIAWKTVRTLQRTIPCSLQGVMFLSGGGQTEEEATERLNEMNKLNTKKPWTLSFSYARALQFSCLRTWLGKSENVELAQKTFLLRAKKNSEASLGRYKKE